MNLFAETKEPLYVTIRRDVLANIQDGTWPIGEKLPSEEEFQKKYDVSRGTVRQALTQLEAEGFVIRRPGRGTFVTRLVPKLQKRLGEIVSFTEQLQRAGYKPRTEVLATGVIKASEAEGRVQEAFGIADDADIVHVKRLRLGDGIPFSIQSVYFLPQESAGILEQDLSHLFKLYEQTYDRKIMSADETIQSAGATAEEATLLGLKRGEPVMIRDRISFDQDNQPFEVLHSVDRGDSYVYRYRILNDQTWVPEKHGDSSA